MECVDYVPFGEEIPRGMGGRSGCYGSLASPQYPAPPDLQNVKFTGKERDNETGLDYFGARYFSGAQGRFTSPDPTLMSSQRISDPQQWNLYSYTRNNPLKYIDPDGHELKVALRNSSRYSNEVMRHAAEHMAAKFQAAGVKVVTIEIESGRVGAGENLISGFTGTDYLEVRGDRSGAGFLGTDIPGQERGHNFNLLGGLEAVDTSGIAKLTDDPEHAAVGIANLASHEIAHDVEVGHPDDRVMSPPNGANDPKWLFQENQFGPKMQKGLQEKFNKPGEKPVVTITTKPDEKKDN
jgi:RHS repeat-associated protein